MSIIKHPIDSAPEILKEAIRCIGDRAKEREMDQERSMKRCVAAFNAMTGHTLSEEEGWLFMVFLKVSRSQQGEFKLDDYVDMAAYAALAGECAMPAPQMELSL